MAEAVAEAVREKKEEVSTDAGRTRCKNLPNILVSLDVLLGSAGAPFCDCREQAIRRSGGGEAPVGRGSVSARYSATELGRHRVEGVHGPGARQ